MRIPNEEILSIYENTIREWFNQRVKTADFRLFYEAVLTGKSEQIADFISHQLMGSISYYDNAESFYHGYLVGTFSGLEGYELTSNRETGDDRPDIKELCGGACGGRLSENYKIRYLLLQEDLHGKKQIIIAFTEWRVQCLFHCRMNCRMHI